VTGFTRRGIKKGSEATSTTPPPFRFLMRAHSIATLLRRLDGLVARAVRARLEMESAKAESDERRRILTGTREIWRRNLNAWLRQLGGGQSG
jgi:hypothetical protein